jgi:hypothetical protein
MEKRGLTEYIVEICLKPGERTQRRSESDGAVTTCHFIEVSRDKRKKGAYLVENVFIVKIARRFESRREAWDCAYSTARWDQRKELPKTQPRLYAPESLVTPKRFGGRVHERESFYEFHWKGFRICLRDAELIPMSLQAL